MNLLSSVFFSGRTGSTSDPKTRGGSESLPGYTMEWYKSRQGSDRHPYSFVEDAPKINKSNVSMAYVAVFVVAIIVLIVAVVKK